MHFKEDTMRQIEKFLKNSIKENTGFLIENIKDNILSKNISPLDFLYVIYDIEQTYGLLAKDIINNTTPDSFTIECIAKVILEKSSGN